MSTAKHLLAEIGRFLIESEIERQIQATANRVVDFEAHKPVATAETGTHQNARQQQSYLPCHWSGC
jgi:hypothetical protein